MKKKGFWKDNFKYFNILVTLSSLLPAPTSQCEDYLIAAHVLLLRSQAEPKEQLEKEVQMIGMAKQQEILEACSFFLLHSGALIYILVYFVWFQNPLFHPVKSST